MISSLTTFVGQTFFLVSAIVIAQTNCCFGLSFLPAIKSPLCVVQDFAESVQQVYMHVLTMEVSPRITVQFLFKTSK